MKKIVFITCTPDMWEGFETLYLEHLNDPECEITVIPAIIYTKNADGDGINPVSHTMGFPDYVTLTPLEKYSFSKEMPDTIYIQNAHDNDNLGLSLHPLLYTKELKKYTNDLVYVPFNVFDESTLSDSYCLDEMRNLLVPPRIKNVNRIIVQSEAMKRAFITLIAGADPVEIENWEKRITFEDYPRTKLLKLLKKEDLEVPSEWKRHMENPDGSAKKVTLFCSAISSTLIEDRSAFRRMRETIDSFKDKKDCCLIWRPHPEMAMVLKKLRPYIVSDYLDILEYYKESDIGILDDCPTPTASIVLSDEYLGDPCAAAELYKSTGKPMTIQKREVSLSCPHT